MVSMANLSQHYDHIICQLASECLSKLHTAENIPHWGPKLRTMFSFWRISSQVVFVIAKQILDNKQGEEGLKSLLNLLTKLLLARNDFLDKNQDRANEGADVRERLQASVALEIALLVSLCSSNPDICSDATRCLGYLCDEARLADEDEDPQQNQITLTCNLPVYADLACEDTVFLGRKVQQKRIRKYLRMITRHTPGNLAAWEEAWKRWKMLTQIMIRYNDESVTDDTSTEISLGSSKKTAKSRPTGSTAQSSQPSSLQTTSSKPVTISPLGRIDIDDDKQTLWHNYTGFLASLGGCCLASDNQQMTDDPRRSLTPSEPAVMVDKFISEMVNLLVSENVVMREAVKETLGTDLSPALYSILFRHLEAVMSRAFDADGEAVYGMRNTLFVEEAVLVLKLILGRLNDPSDCLLNIDFGALMQQFARYLNKLPNNVATLRIKTKMCSLVEALMEKKEQIIVRDEMRLRNKLLEIMVEWTSDFGLVWIMKLNLMTAALTTAQTKIYIED